MADKLSKPVGSGTGKVPEMKSGEAKTVVSARKAKRIKWWYDSVQKRLDSDEIPPVSAKPGVESETAKMRKDKKFAVFVGQIPFDAVEAEVREMFEKIALPGKLKNFRWRSSPRTKKFLGFAFVEFENKGAYRRSFELHHTLVNGRPINVEATSAGGKKSRFRKDHIKEETLKCQKKAQEAIERKARDAAKRKRPLPETDTAATTHTETDPQGNSSKSKTTETSAETVSLGHPVDKNKPDLDSRKSLDLPSPEGFSNSGKNGDKAKKAMIVTRKTEKIVGEPLKKSEQEKGVSRHVLEEPRGLQKMKNERQTMDKAEGKPAWIKPRELHLSSIDKPRLHIKFD